jgi:hypothetical protein
MSPMGMWNLYGGCVAVQVQSRGCIEHWQMAAGSSLAGRSPVGTIPSLLAASIPPGPASVLHGRGTVPHVRIDSVLVNASLPDGCFFEDRSSTSRGDRGVVLESRASQKMVGMLTCE